MEKVSHEQIHYPSDTGILLNVHQCDSRYVPSHWHNGLEIVYIFSGRLAITAGEKEYAIEDGGFAVVNSRTIHSTCARVGSKNLLIQVPYDILKRNVSDFDLISIKCVCLSREGWSSEKHAAIGALLEKMGRLCEAPHKRGYQLIQTSLVYELLYLLIKDFSTGADLVLREKTDRNIERLGVVLQYAREHYNEDIYLQDVADLVALNREYFARFFKKYMGITFLDYLQSIRLEHARDDILNTDISTVEISEKNGFGKNYHTFLRKFKEQYGCLPGQFRRQMRSSER